MRINIEKIIYPGKSLSRKDNKIVLTDSGIAGETVKCSLVKDKKNYIQAKTDAVITPSAHRKDPRCTHFHICSAYQYIDYEQQLKIKKDQLQEIFSNFPGQLISKKVRASNIIWGYRNKIHLHIITDNNTTVCAYHAPGKSNKFTPIDRCFLATDLMNRLISEFLLCLAPGMEKYVNEITLQRSLSSKKFLLCCYGPLKKKELEVLNPMLELKNKFSLAGIVYINKRKAEKSILFGKDQLSEKVAGKTFLFGCQSFFQINIPMLELLIKDLKKELPHSAEQSLLDLYCGVGTFAIALSGFFPNIKAVDSSRANISFLKKNMSINAISHIETVNAKCANWIKNAQKKPPDTIIVDPPRRGLENEVIEAINKIKPGLIAYISCDPATLCRDLKKLFQEYSLRNINAYDFFPHTPHIETLSILEKKLA
ncbi:MAG: 23S rRNA (uracil(1939)-C(5))-methyltransferase RlmD [Candidatus Omnitrophica bacterium]|nr:23S rRNA (uracil(1939)-C(5))-methyltransferase RlmD [Candidatus Omnitrophota bacterium]